MKTRIEWKRIGFLILLLLVFVALIPINFHIITHNWLISVIIAVVEFVFVYIVISIVMGIVYNDHRKDKDVH